MSILGLPDLGEDDSEDLMASGLPSFGGGRSSVLPLLALGGGAALGGGGGMGSLIQGLVQGLQAGQAMRERRRLQAEAKAEREGERAFRLEERAFRQRQVEEDRAFRRQQTLSGLLRDAGETLKGITDEGDYAQATRMWEAIATKAGLDPSEIRKAFPFRKELTVKARQAAIDTATRNVLNTYPREQLADPDWQRRTSVRLPDGTDVSIADLFTQSTELAKEKTLRPILEERPAPAITGTGPGLERAGLPQRVITGREEVTVPALPRLPGKEPKRVVVVDNTGKVVQSLEVPAGTEVRTVTAPKPDQPQRFVITDSQGRTVRTITAPAGTQVRILPQPRKGDGVGGDGIPLPLGPGTGRYRIVKGARGGQAVMDTQTGVRLTIAQAHARAKQDPELAKVLGIRLGPTAEPTEKVGTTPMTLGQIEDEARIVGGRLGALRQQGVDGRGSNPEDKEYNTLSLRLQQLTQARSRLSRRGQQPQLVTPPGQKQADPLGIR